MAEVRRVEEKRRNELTLPARLGRQDKSNGAWVRLSHCLHIQDLSLLARYVSPQCAQVAQCLREIRLHAPFGFVVRRIPRFSRQQCGRILGISLHVDGARRPTVASKSRSAVLRTASTGRDYVAPIEASRRQGARAFRKDSEMGQ
jgi:hypothetical protein